MYDFERKKSLVEKEKYQYVKEIIGENVLTIN